MKHREQGEIGRTKTNKGPTDFTISSVNPTQPATQNFERTTESTLPLPAGTKVEGRTVTRDETKLEAPPALTEKTIVLTAPTVQTTRTVEKAGTTIGAAQKDTARELGAKLASLKGIVWVGVAMFFFGIATLAYPPLRAIVGSVTTSVAIIVGGIALMVLPTLRLLGFAEHDIQISMAARKLPPLGDPAQNAPKWFAAIEIVELAADKDWLHKARKEVSKYWQHKRARRSAHVEKVSPDSSPEVTPAEQKPGVERAMTSGETSFSKAA